jgi:hypothetical protein
MSYRLCLALVVGALVAACSYTENRTVAAVPVEDSCTYYGYAPGTESYRLCAEREAAARRRGRVAADYAEARIVSDSQDACTSYGLLPGSDRYDRCVQREITYRRPT